MEDNHKFLTCGYLHFESLLIMNNGLILDDVLKTQSESDDKQSIVKSKNSLFFKKDITNLKRSVTDDKDSDKKDSKVNVEDNSITTQTSDKTDVYTEFTAVINSENRVYSNTEQGKYEDPEYATGVYQTTLLFPETENNAGEIDISKDRAKVRCSCPHYRFFYGSANEAEGFLAGGDFDYYYKKTNRVRNSARTYGMCKHLIYFISTLLKNGTITDSTGQWESIVNSTTADLKKPELKSVRKKVSQFDDKVKQQRAKEIISHSNHFAKKAATPAQGSSKETWESWVNDAYSKFVRLDRLSKRYGKTDEKGNPISDIDFDVSDLDIPGVDKLEKDKKTLSQLRKYWIGEYNKRTEEYLKHKGLDKTQINIRKAKTHDGIDTYVLPTKIGSRLKGGDITNKTRSEIKSEEEEYKIREAKRMKAIEARKFMKDLAKQKHKTFSEIELELKNKAKSKKMTLIDYIWKLIKRKTEIEQAKQTELRNAEREKEKKQRDIERRNEQIKKKRAELNKLNLQIGYHKSGYKKLSPEEVRKINRRRLELDNFLRNNVSGHISSPDLAKLRMKKTGVATPKPTLEKPKDKISKISKPKLKKTSVKIDNNEEKEKEEKSNSIELDDEESEVEIKRDKAGNVIIPAKPSKSAFEEDKLLYMKSIEAEINQLKMMTRHINSGHMKVKPGEKESILKRINSLANDLIEAQDEYNISLDEI